MQATLAEGGIKASIVTGTGNQVYGAMRARNFEIIVARGAERYPHPYFSLRTFACNPNNSDDAGLPNFQGWRASFFNPQLNSLIDQAGVERDSAQRLSLYHQAQKLSGLKVLRHLLRNPMTLAGLLVAMLLVGGAAFAPWIATHDPVAQNLANALQAPGAAHCCGTDEYGRDIFSRLVYGSRITLYIITLVTVIQGLSFNAMDPTPP